MVALFKYSSDFWTNSFVFACKSAHLNVLKKLTVFYSSE